MTSGALRFRRLGRGWHPCVDDGHALVEVLDLDEALWIATAAPVSSFRADPVFLARLDADGDGRIRADEVRAAIRWLLATLSDPGDIREGHTSVRLSALAEGAEGVRATARLVLERTPLPEGGDPELVELAAVRAVRAEELARGVVEAGCVRPAAGKDAELVGFLTHIAETTGAAAPAEPTVTTASMERFLHEGRAWLGWHARGAPGPDGAPAHVLPFGDATPGAWALCESLAPGLDHYFVLCDAVRLDPRLAAYALPDPTGADLADPVATRALLARAPVAAPRPDGRLPLRDGLNPVYEARIARLRDKVLPLLGPAPVPEGSRSDTIDRVAWAELRARVAPYASWIAERPVTRIGARDPAEIRAHVEDAALVVRARALLAESHVTAERIAGLQALEQLLLYQAGMLPFVNSFVTCRDLYEPDREALFEWGTLVLDGRWFRLAVRVPDPVRHEIFTRRGALCVMYVEVGDGEEGWDYEVAVPVTAGMRGFLVEGMWGVFVEHSGRERHARVRTIVLHPISLRDAIFSPFRRLAEALQGAVDKAGAAQEASMDKALATARGEVPVQPPVAPVLPGALLAPKPAAAAGVLAILAGAGIALAAVSSALAYISDRFVAAASTIGAWIVGLPVVTALPPDSAEMVRLLAYPSAVFVVIVGMLAVPLLTYLVPVCVAAWLKLRRRDLGALLIGSGWAVNTRLYVTRDVEHLFTQQPVVRWGRRRG